MDAVYGTMTQLTDTEMYKILQACAARLRQDPDDADALFYVGAIYARIGKLKASMMYLDRLTRIDEEYPGLWRAKAGVFRKLGNDDLFSMCLKRAEAQIE